MSKKKIISSYLIYSIVQGKHRLLRKQNLFHVMNDELNMVRCELLRKFSYWKNLLLYWMMLTKLKNLSVFELWTIMTT